MPDIDLEELKRRLAEAEVSAAYMLDLERAMYEIGVSLTKRTLIVAAVNALPDLIARVERAEKERDRLREELRYACSALIGAARSYRVHAGRSGHIRPRSRPDPFFLTRVSDMDKAAEQARAALTGDTPNV